jgi:ubiquinone/menaquinone biosynthesis C-methylase UbiE
MEFGEYYKNKSIVESYEEKRAKGVKGNITRKLERKLVELLLSGTGKNILEAGVGTGFITEILLKHGKVEGFDISKEMISKTKKRFRGIRLKEGNILSFKSKKKYNTIVSVRVISHFKFGDAERALKNLKGALKNDGCIIFNLENKSFIRRLLRKLTRWGSTETYQYSEYSRKALVERAGLKIKEVLYLDHLFLVPIHLVNKLIGGMLDNFILNLELNLSKLEFASNNSFIKCQK